MRRGRPISVTDETIFDAARAVFAEAGMNASAVQIAKRAGVSEATIFKRFASKAGLIRAALGMDDIELEQPFESLIDRVGRGEVLTNLGRAAVELVTVRRRLDPLVRAEADWRGIERARRETCARLVEAYVRAECAADRLPERVLADAHAWSIAFVAALFGVDPEEMGSSDVGEIVRALAVGLVGPVVHVVFGPRAGGETAPLTEGCRGDC